MKSKINIVDVACSLMDNNEYWNMIWNDVSAVDTYEWLDPYLEEWEWEPEKYEFLLLENSYYQGQIYGTIYFGVCKTLSEAQAWLDNVREDSRDRYKCYRSPMTLKIVCKIDGHYNPQSNRYKTVYKIEPVEIL